MIRRAWERAEVPMPRLLSALGACVVLLSACGGDDDSGSPSDGDSADAVKVNIASFDYSPKTVKVKAGSTITWTNQDKAEHTAQTDDAAKGFDTKDLKTGDTKEITFDAPGTYSYYCIYHRFMTGKVEVTR